MMDTEILAVFLFLFVLFLVLFLILREVFLWYWKINERADLLTEISSHIATQESILSDIHQIIKYHFNKVQNDYIKENDTQENDMSNEISSSVDALIDKASLNEKEPTSHQSYQVVFSGKINKNTSLEMVKKNFLDLYKSKYDSATIDKKFFSKKSIVIKKGLEFDKAKKFIKHFSAKTGGVFQIEKM